MIDDVRPDKPKGSHHIPIKLAPDELNEPQAVHSHPGHGFQTPDEVAADDNATTNDPVISKLGQQAIEQPKDQGRWAVLLDWRPTRKQWLIIAVVLIVVLAGGTFMITHHKKVAPIAAIVKTAPLIKPSPPPAPAPVVSTLTGLPIANAGINNRPVTGVMIENSLEARPQSGLDQAGVVFEAIAEAGITRFLALYQDTQPDYLGPVRSARPYFIQWDMGFDAPLAHVGGSPEALSDITSWGVKDLNEFYNASGYERISSRAAPHNDYTSAAQLNTLEYKLGFNASTYTGFPHKDDSPSKAPNASSITISPSSPDYSSQYAYNASTNNYARSEGGKPHMEVSASGKQAQITPKVVIAMVMQYSLEADGEHSQYNVVGNGPVYVFQDGIVTQGTWSKTSSQSQITFTSTSNQPIKLNAGQAWITAVGSASDVSYK